jgi:IS4 transposase
VWLTRGTLAAWRETVELREVRYGLDMLGFRTCQLTLVTTRLDVQVYRVADLYRQRWQVETSPAPRKTTMPMDVLHGKTGPGVLQALAVLAIVDNLVHLVMCQSAMRQHIGGERMSVLDARR